MGYRGPSRCICICDVCESDGELKIQPALQICPVTSLGQNVRYAGPQNSSLVQVFNWSPRKSGPWHLARFCLNFANSFILESAQPVIQENYEDDDEEERMGASFQTSQSHRRCLVPSVSVVERLFVYFCNNANPS